MRLFVLMHPSRHGTSSDERGGGGGKRGKHPSGCGRSHDAPTEGKSNMAISDTIRCIFDPSSSRPASLILHSLGRPPPRSFERGSNGECGDVTRRRAVAADLAPAPARVQAGPIAVRVRRHMPRVSDRARCIIVHRPGIATVFLRETAFHASLPPSAQATRGRRLGGGGGPPAFPDRIHPPSPALSLSAPWGWGP